MGIEIILGWEWKIRRLRRRWDRLREKSLKKKEPLKTQLLQRLDLIEGNISTLEEQKLGFLTRKRIADDVNMQLKSVKTLIK
jgi:hypothetical protein